MAGYIEKGTYQMVNDLLVDWDSTDPNDYESSKVNGYDIKGMIELIINKGQ
jgi:hypothetical protein